MFPNTLLQNKNVLLGVTGSISAYKSLELIRLLTKAGANVRVIATQGALKFVTKLTFETLTANIVLDDTTQSWHTDNNHISIGKWADIFIIAPCTANTINKLANGLADNLLSQTALAYDRVKLLAPAANTAMLNNPLTQASIKLLKLANFTLIETQNKELACKTQGNGALAEPLELFYHVAQQLLRDPYWENRRVVVTGGGTTEKIDDIRFISNFSSGKMASSLAQALFFKGADVCFISSKFPIELPKTICSLDVQSAHEMQEYLVDALRMAKKGVMTKPTLIGDSVPELVQKTPFLFMAAAVADYKVKFEQSGKLKKEMLGDGFNLEMIKNTDILATTNREGVVSIGFKAEMDVTQARQNASTMLTTKDLHAVCLNVLQDSSSFGSDTNAIEFITTTNSVTLDTQDKLSLCLALLDQAKNLAS